MAKLRACRVRCCFDDSLQQCCTHLSLPISWTKAEPCRPQAVQRCGCEHHRAVPAQSGGAAGPAT